MLYLRRMILLLLMNSSRLCNWLLQSVLSKKKFSYPKQRKKETGQTRISSRMDAVSYFENLLFLLTIRERVLLLSKIYEEKRNLDDTKIYWRPNFVNYNCIKFFRRLNGSSTLLRDLSVEWFKGFDGRQYRLRITDASCKSEISSSINFFFSRSIGRYKPEIIW